SRASGGQFHSWDLDSNVACTAALAIARGSGTVILHLTCMKISSTRKAYDWDLTLIFRCVRSEGREPVACKIELGDTYLFSGFLLRRESLGIFGGFMGRQQSQA